MAHQVSDITCAVKKLRTALKDSQQAFASRLGVSQGAIANYEAGRTPTLAVLSSLSGLATRNRQDELAAIFREAYKDGTKGVLTPIWDEEKALVRMVLSLVRNKELVPGWAGIEQDLVAKLEGLVKKAEAGEAVMMTDPSDLQEALNWARHQFTPTAEQKLRRLADERFSQIGGSHPGNFPVAYMQVVAENPELYRQFLEDYPGILDTNLPRGSQAILSASKSPRNPKTDRRPQAARKTRRSKKS